MEKYEYKTLTVDARRASVPDALVGEQLNKALQDDWEYLNGPTVTGAGVYIFMMRRPIPARPMTQEEFERMTDVNGPVGIESDEVHPAMKPF